MSSFPQTVPADSRCRDTLSSSCSQGGGHPACRPEIGIRATLNGQKEGTLEGALNLIPPGNLYIPYIVPTYLTSPQITPK